ncbi:unnamed protein product, partial [Sphacelaria rigidula]
QGDEIRELKKSKPDKAVIMPHVDELKSLKAQYKTKTGKDYAPPAAAAPVPKASAKASPEATATVAESPAATALAAKIVAK